MTTNSAGEESYTHGFSAVQEAEIDWIKKARKVNNVPETAPVIGLAFSGGGIRSATFNLGVLQALAALGWLSRFDYLSTVSGGGFIGSFYSWVKAHYGSKTPIDLGSIKLFSQNGTVLDWLRDHGKYLINGSGFSFWTLIASIFAGLLLNLIVLLPLFLVVFFLLGSNWFGMTWPVSMHLPGAPSVVNHDGFMVILIAGLGSFICYFASVFLFAFSNVFRPLSELSKDYFFRRWMGRFLAFSVIAFAVGILPIIAELDSTVLFYTQNQTWQAVSQHMTYALPFITGLILIIGSKNSAAGPSNSASKYSIIGLNIMIYGLFIMLYHVVSRTSLLETDWFAVWALISLVMAFVCDVNNVSMHSYYRSRLALAYLPKLDNQTSPVAYPLKNLSPQKGCPVHIINTTLNTSSSEEEKLRSREGESMFLSSLYCGSTSTGYRKTADYCGGELALSTAMSVSGAAIEPDTTAVSSRGVNFLMALLNIRLGVWIDNPKIKPKMKWVTSWYQLLLREMLDFGLTSKSKKINLSDGGHFENLGIYELVRRECKYIIACDAGADPTANMLSLGQLIQKVRADFGAEIDIDTNILMQGSGESVHKSAHVVGHIRYSNGTVGMLLYLKALIVPGLNTDVMAYKRNNPSFPNQSTSDQFFDEMQFDSYRELGLQLMMNVADPVRNKDIEAVFSL
jgi:hypothetical protein